MFFGAEREPLVREMFIAGELWRREPGPEAASALRGGARSGSSGCSARTSPTIFAAMDGLPVAIRLLDPPMHEFLDPEVLERELAEARDAGDARRRSPARPSGSRSRWPCRRPTRCSAPGACGSG